MQRLSPFQNPKNKKIFIYCEVSCLNVPKQLVTNDHFNVMGQSAAFSEIIADVVCSNLDMVYTQVVLAQEVIHGMP